MRLLKEFLIIGLALLAVELLVQHVFAQSPTTAIPFNPRLYPGVDFGSIVSGTGAEGVVGTLRGVYRVAKQLLGPIMVALIAGFGIQLIFSGGDEETLNKTAKNFLYLLVGIAFVVFADFLSQTFFLYRDFAGQESTFLSGEQQIDTTAFILQSQLELLIMFMRYLLGGIAVFYIVKSGAVIIFGSAEEDTVNKEKEVFMYGFLGFIIIMVSEALVNAVFDVQTLPGVAQVNVAGGLGLLANITNFLLALVGGLSMFTLVIGGAMYTFTAGNEERGQQATKLIYGSLIGIVIAFSSYTIVSEFSRSNPIRFETQEEISSPVSPLGTIVPGP